MELIAAWMRQYFWDRKELLKFVLSSAAVEDRGVEYFKKELDYLKNSPLGDYDKMHREGDSKGMGEISGMQHGSMGEMIRDRFPHRVQ